MTGFLWMGLAGRGGHTKLLLVRYHICAPVPCPAFPPARQTIPLPRRSPTATLLPCMLLPALGLDGGRRHEFEDLEGDNIKGQMQ